MQTDIPSSFDLLGRRVEVIFDNEKCAKEEALGLCDSDFSKIYLADNYKGKALPHQVISQNFLHEVVHCILDAMGETKLSANEKFVDLFAGMMHQILSSGLYLKEFKDDSQDQKV
jgi:hypothetical protein